MLSVDFVLGLIACCYVALLHQPAGGLRFRRSKTTAITKARKTRNALRLQTFSERDKGNLVAPPVQFGHGPGPQGQQLWRPQPDEFILNQYLAGLARPQVRPGAMQRLKEEQRKLREEQQKDLERRCRFTDHQWDDWSDCTAQCGGGLRFRRLIFRTTAAHKENDGRFCPNAYAWTAKGLNEVPWKMAKMLWEPIFADHPYPGVSVSEDVKKMLDRGIPGRRNDGCISEGWLRKLDVCGPAPKNSKTPCTELSFEACNTHPCDDDCSYVDLGSHVEGFGMPAWWTFHSRPPQLEFPNCVFQFWESLPDGKLRLLGETNPIQKAGPGPMTVILNGTPKLLVLQHGSGVKLGVRRCTLQKINKATNDSTARICLYGHDAVFDENRQKPPLQGEFRDWLRWSKWRYGPAWATSLVGIAARSEGVANGVVFQPPLGFQPPLQGYVVIPNSPQTQPQFDLSVKMDNRNDYPINQSLNSP